MRPARCQEINCRLFSELPRFVLKGAPFSAVEPSRIGPMSLFQQGMQTPISV